MGDDVKKAANMVKDAHKAMTGTEAWREIRGQNFEHEEARQAADFADLMESYGFSQDYEVIDPQELIDFLDDAHDLPVGARLWLAEKLPIETLGVVMLGEDDDRVMRVAKDRCQDNARGGRTILLPGEE